MLIPTCMVKIIELALTIACLVLHNYCYDLTDVTTLMLCSGTYIGYVVVLTGEIIGEMLYAPLDLVQDMYFGILGIVLFSVSGGLLLAARIKGSVYPRTGDHNSALVLGSLSAVVAVILFFDLSLAYLDSEEYDEEATEAVSASADAYVDAWWSASGAALFSTCGALMLHSWRDIPACARKSHAQAAAICSLAAASLMLVNSVVTLCSVSKEGTSIRTKSVRTVNPCNKQ